MNVKIDKELILQWYAVITTLVVMLLVFLDTTQAIIILWYSVRLLMMVILLMVAWLLATTLIAWLAGIIVWRKTERNKHGCIMAKFTEDGKVICKAKGIPQDLINGVGYLVIYLSQALKLDPVYIADRIKVAAKETAERDSENQEKGSE